MNSNQYYVHEFSVRLHDGITLPAADGSNSQPTSDWNWSWGTVF